MKTQKEVIDDVLKVKIQLGCIPTRKDYRKHGAYSEYEILSHFKSWNAFLEKVFGQTHTGRGETKICGQCHSPFYRKRNDIRRNFSGRFFCSTSCAASYNNTHKTTGIRRSKLEVYLEEQLTKKYPNLEIHYNRKDTINSELDIYVPSLKLAFELNGVFHYEPIFGEAKLLSIQNNDDRKFQACIEKEIEMCLIDVSNMINFKEPAALIFRDIVFQIIDQKQMLGDSNPR